MHHTELGISSQDAATVKLQPTEVGVGVFALRGFQDHDVVGWITGKVIDDPQYSSDYCIDLGGSLSLEPVAPFRFLNHSCEPNCEFTWDDVDPNSGQIPQVYVYALRNIAAGEQLTIDYNWPADSAIACRCLAENCRGWIVTLDEMDQIKPQGVKPPNPDSVSF